jgi:PBP superfamily domain
MSGHDTGPGPQPHHARHPVIRAAAAAVILLALGACSSTTTSTAITAASAGPGGDTGTLTGAGSTYVAPFFALAFATYHQQHPAVTVTYSAVGSSAGIAAISAQQVNSGASDVPMNPGELAAATGGPITQVPDARPGRRTRNLTCRHTVEPSAPAVSAATIVAVRNSSDRGTVPVGSQRSAIGTGSRLSGITAVRVWCPRSVCDLRIRPGPPEFTLRAVGLPGRRALPSVH